MLFRSSLRRTVDTVRSVSKAPLVLVVLGDKAGEGYYYGYSAAPGRTVKYRQAAQGRSSGGDDSKRHRRPVVVDVDETDLHDAPPLGDAHR